MGRHAPDPKPGRKSSASTASNNHDGHKGHKGYDGEDDRVSASGASNQESRESRESQAQYDRVWELAADAMALSDEQGIVLAANPAYYQLYGYTPQEVIGQSFAIIFPQEQRASAVEQYKKTFTDPQIAPSMESFISRKDGSTRVVEARYTFITHNGKRTSMLSLVRDLTDRKRVEEERDRLLAQEQAARARAEQALIHRDELLAVVAHDLRNPLTAIKGNIQLLKRRLAHSSSDTTSATSSSSTVSNRVDKDWDKVREGLSQIEVTSIRMTALIDELTDFALLQEGQLLTLQRKQTDLVSLVREIVEEYQKVSGNQRISLETTEKRLVGQWDTPRIERVVTNLLSNAVKYNLKGGEIEVRVMRTEGELPEQAVEIKERPQQQGIERGTKEEGTSCPCAVLMVRDMGIGIPEEELPHIFDWFRRGANVSEQVSGAGIGLANVLQIVEQHGGSITVESKEGVGSTFTVRLPLNT